MLIWLVDWGRPQASRTPRKCIRMPRRHTSALSRYVILGAPSGLHRVHGHQATPKRDTFSRSKNLRFSEPLRATASATACGSEEGRLGRSILRLVPSPSGLGYPLTRLRRFGIRFADEF